MDEKFIASGKAVHLTEHLVVLPLEGAGPFRALQAGVRLDLRTPSGNINFALTGTAKAMSALLDCVKTINGERQVQARHVAKDFQVISQAEAAVMLTNLLNSAGVSGYHLEMPNGREAFVTYSFPDGTRGMFTAARGNATKTADDYSGTVISHLSEACKGEFLTGKKSIPSVDGSVIRRVISTCRGDAGPVTMETTIIRRPSGLLLQLTQTLGASDASDNGETTTKSDQNRAALIDAALRLPDSR